LLAHCPLVEFADAGARQTFDEAHLAQPAEFLKYGLVGIGLDVGLDRGGVRSASVSRQSRLY